MLLFTSNPHSDVESLVGGAATTDTAHAHPLDRAAEKLLTRTRLEWTHKNAPILPRGFDTESMVAAAAARDRRMPLDVPPPVAAAPAQPRASVRPELVAEVKFLTWTDDNLLPQVVYQGLREDKPAQDVARR